VPGKAKESVVEFAVLARGDDPGLEQALKKLVADFSQGAESKLKSS